VETLAVLVQADSIITNFNHTKLNKINIIASEKSIFYTVSY
jgi:hypothetical protein